MTFTNLEQYVYSEKCLKQRFQPPYPSPQQSRKYFRAKKVTWLYGCYLQLNIQQIE